MFKYYNAHPRRLSVDDCVKRSITLATGIPYIEVQKGLNDHKKITRVKRFYHPPNPRSYMEKVLGFERVVVAPKADGTCVTVEEFAKLHPLGRYVLSILGHWTACIDGVIYDTWDCGEERVLSYYEVTDFNRTQIEKKYCYIVRREGEGKLSVTVYDGNGISASKVFDAADACVYEQNLRDRGFFNFDEIGEYI